MRTAQIGPDLRLIHRMCIPTSSPPTQSQGKAPWGRGSCVFVAQITGHEWGLFALSRLRTSFFSSVLLNPGSLAQAGGFLKVLWRGWSAWSSSTTQRKNMIVDSLCVVLRFSSSQTVVVLQCMGHYFSVISCPHKSGLETLEVKCCQSPFIVRRHV